MKTENDILKKINRKTGMTVPDGYFEQFAGRMMDELPQRTFDEPVKVTTWQKLKPYLYMAAMFGGIWLMMKVFVAPHIEQDDTTIVAQAQASTDDDALDDYLLAQVDEYTLFETLYADNE